MTTQTVTVLFTDLVGSTELSSALGPKAADELRQTHFGLLRGAIRTTGGNEVKNLGDGLMVAFTGLNRALACAVTIQQAIERHNRLKTGSPLSVRIGISTGDAIEEDGDYFGDPVVEASRLCGKARGGQILTTTLVKLMAGRHATVEFLSVGDMELKGLPAAVPSVEVRWEGAQVTESIASYVEISGVPFPLETERVTVGRAGSNSLAISDDDTVSRLHAVLERYAPGWVIRDLGSPNGTFINGERLLGERLLHSGDQIRVGNSHLVFRTRDAIPPKATIPIGPQSA